MKKIPTRRPGFYRVIIHGSQEVAFYTGNHWKLIGCTHNHGEEFLEVREKVLDWMTVEELRDMGDNLTK